MRRSDLPKLTPILAALGGYTAMFLRIGLYESAVDATGRITSGHPLSWGLLLLSAAVLLLCLWAVRGQEGSQLYADNFSVDLKALIGHGAFAYGIYATVTGGTPPTPASLGQVWKILGLLSVPALAAAGWCRWKGKTPPLVCYIPVPLFLTAHLISHYQLWCSNPQIQDVLFPLSATIALTVFAYQQAAFAADMGSRRQMLLAGSLAIYLCLGEMAVGSYSTLYVSGILWVFTGLCHWKEV